jgi:hypothetical protein
MNKREFIVELWKQVEGLCQKLNIKCSKCLDMKRMWTTMKDTETHQLIDCVACTDLSLNPISIPVCIINDDEFYGNIGGRQVLLFEDKDDTPGSRFEILKEMEEMEEELNHRECTRISELLIKRDTEFADGSLIERFGENQARVFSRNLHYNRLQPECNELMREIVGVNRFPWNKKYEIPLVFTWPDIYTHSYYWDMIEDENMMPIYFFIILQGQNYMNWLKIIDTCSLFSDEVHIQIKTYLIYPKNDSAVDKCRRIVADIKKNHTLLDQLIQ